MIIVCFGGENLLAVKFSLTVILPKADWIFKRYKLRNENGAHVPIKSKSGQLSQAPARKCSTTGNGGLLNSHVSRAPKLNPCSGWERVNQAPMAVLDKK